MGRKSVHVMSNKMSDASRKLEICKSGACLLHNIARNARQISREIPQIYCSSVFARSI